MDSDNDDVAAGMVVSVGSYTDLADTMSLPSSVMASAGDQHEDVDGDGDESVRFSASLPPSVKGIGSLVSPAVSASGSKAGSLASHAATLVAEGDGDQLAYEDVGQGCAQRARLSSYSYSASPSARKSRALARFQSRSSSVVSVQSNQQHGDEDELHAMDVERNAEPPGERNAEPPGEREELEDELPIGSLRDVAAQLVHLNIETNVKVLSNEELEERAEHWFDVWNPSTDGEEVDMYDIARQVISGAFGDIKSNSGFREQFVTIASSILTLKHEMMARGMIKSSSSGSNQDGGGGDSSVDTQNRIVCIMRNIRNAYDIALRLCQWRLGGSVNSQSQLPGDSTLFSYFVPTDIDNEPDYRKLFRFMLNKCEEKQLVKRRDHEFLYAPVYTARDPVTGKGGYFTHTYTQLAKAQHFVCQSVAPKEMYSEQWGWLYSARRNRVHIAEDLLSCVDWQCPYMIKDRHMIAWRNGMFITADNKFYKWDDEDDMRELNILCYGSSTSGSSTREVRRAAAKYHDVDFDNDAFEAALDNDDDGDWFHSIKTPLVQQILDHQQLSEAVQRWVWVLLGRMFFYIGEFDNWQITPFFKGVASSGKSTLLRHLKRVFDAEDVGIIGNNCEINFSLESISESFMWLALDIKENFRLDQTTFQSMGSGEELSISRKHQLAVMKVWNSPGAMASNVTPSGTWKDNSNSLARRLALIMMRKIVKNVDPTLFDRMYGEIAPFVKKCVTAYKLAVKAHGKRSFWDVAPREFHDNARKFSQQVNLLSSFLNRSELVVVRPGSYMREADFVSDLKKFCIKTRRNHGEVPTFEEDFYTTVFQQHDITVERKTLPCNCYDPNAEPVEASWIIGVCSMNDSRNLDEIATEAEIAAATDDLDRFQLDGDAAVEEGGSDAAVANGGGDDDLMEAEEFGF